ncbi:hypothetical protein ACTFIY_010871 [Dictyostelium cf. discoideum]
MTEPVAAPKKKIVLKRAAGSSSSNELPPCKIKVEFIDNDSSSSTSIKSGSSLCVNQMATIESAKYMTIVDQESTIDIKRVIEMTLNLGNTELSYQPGDYISVFAPNTHNHVISLIKRLSLDENKLIKIESIDKTFELPNYLKKVNENFNNKSSTIYNVLRDLVDITGIPSKKLLKLLSENSSDSNDKLELNKLSSIEGKEEYAQMINNRVTLLCLLDKYKSSNPPFNHLLELINPLAPRDYSISSSPLSTEKGTLSFVFSVVDFKLSSTPSQRILGHCTSWLEKTGIQNNKLSSSSNLENSLNNLNINDSNEIRIPFILKPSPHFHLPPVDQLNRPIIMIGPGTGVAPFIGFLQHLSKTTTTTTPNPNTWLFFGCRSEKRDFLYKDTLESMLKDNTLTKLITAFSRELDTENNNNNNNTAIEPTCGYVQEKMIEHSKQLFDMVVNQNAFIYICGDAKGMAVGVRNSFIDIVKQELNCDEKQATDIFTNWIKEKRYILDVWS